MHFTGGRGCPYYCRLFGQNQYFKLDVIKPTKALKKSTVHVKITRIAE
jgi:hypothetical protein